MQDDEPLEQWAAKREKRLRPVGQLKAVIIGHESAAAHLHPQLPRMLFSWDGYQWVSEGIAEDYAAARRFLNNIEGDGVIREMKPRPETTGLRNPLAVGKGRHRRTT